MGKNIDATMVQVKVLNSSKGPAVRALRAQADKRQYSWLMKGKLLAEPNISLRQGEAVEIIRAGKENLLVKTDDGAAFCGTTAVVATGTFLKGEMTIGNLNCPGGRAGEAPSNSVSGSLAALGLELSRFQSATPPRVWAGGVDRAKMATQPGDNGPLSFSFAGDKRPKRRQRDCYLTYTNKKTIAVIKRNLHLSPIRSGSRWMLPTAPALPGAFIPVRSARGSPNAPRRWPGKSPRSRCASTTSCWPSGRRRHRMGPVAQLTRGGTSV